MTKFLSNLKVFLNHEIGMGPDDKKELFRLLEQGFRN